MLIFHRDTPEVRRDEALEVVRVDRGQLVARTGAGAERVVTRQQANAFDVYERRPLEVASHDRLLLTANRQEPRFRATNGELVTVSRIDERGHVYLEDGRRLPATYKHLDHGYAVTAHRSQGQSVDAVVISGESMTRELFYVAASRGREQVTIVTSNKDLLRESLGRSGERQSASELARKIHAGVAHGPRSPGSQAMDRGMPVAWALGRDAATHEQEHAAKLGPAPGHPQEVGQALAQEEAQRSRSVKQGHEHRQGHSYGISR